MSSGDVFRILFFAVALYTGGAEAREVVVRSGAHAVAGPHPSKERPGRAPERGRGEQEEHVATHMQRMHEMRGGGNAVMLIHPEIRAKDLAEAFAFLKQMSPSTRPVVMLTNGEAITDIVDIRPMTGGTMVIFRINSVKGQRFQVVNIGEIDMLVHG
ncbi:MAG: hypothetical protein OXF02_04355 [Simkaniaceae bacterium]|nr:hypothetical protein [Simkaniaceae bacterium]